MLALCSVSSPPEVSEQQELEVRRVRRRQTLNHLAGELAEQFGEEIRVPSLCDIWSKHRAQT